MPDGTAVQAPCSCFRMQVGTEEGLVHRCSTAFSEQGGQAYSGHVAPVYQVSECGLVCWAGSSAAQEWRTLPLVMRLGCTGHCMCASGAGAPLCACPPTHPLSPAHSGLYLTHYLQVCWSPFSPSHFLSASADWSVRLWHEAQPRRPLATLALPGAWAEVADAAFCPAAATLLAAAAANSLQVWVWWMIWADALV